MEKKKLLFSAKNITKSFHGTQALKGVDLDVYEGEVIGLIGENGAGKSTLLKIIIGVQPPSSGEMFMHDSKFEPKTPLEANAAGVGMVYQEQSLITNLSVGQNIFFGHEKEFVQLGFVRWRKMYEEAQKVLEAVGSGHINPRKKVIDLNFATRQMIEIAKVVNVTKSANANGKCLILLDEPTSVLNEGEVKVLFEEIRKLKALGHSVIFVSHRLDEVLEISDRVYVYKDGANAGNMPIEEATETKMYEMMVGHESSSEYYKLDKQITPGEEVVLEVKDLGLWGRFKHCNFKLHKGEILGLCGVVGSGKEEICSVICGDEKPTYGEVILKGKPVKYSEPSQALKDGTLLIPKERMYEGIVRGLPVEDNIAMSNTKRLKKNGLVSKKAISNQAEKYIKLLNIKTRGKDELVIQLSGGNQQKVVFARALASEADILILNHPTRGVDVGAKEEIYSLIRDMVAGGKSVILLGDTLDECISMSNRVFVMKDGLITGEFSAAADAKPSQVQIVSMMV
ncbi:MAG: sugar transporter ATP-binding protein [Bacillota bacterium]|jgi:ribose transport system ATP-binding protein|nr:sugar transporter ATP-binding protein [Bacillota bacterium]